MEVDSCIQIAPTQNQTAEVASCCFSGNHFGNADVSHNAQFTCPKSRNFRESWHILLLSCTAFCLSCKSMTLWPAQIVFNLYIFRKGTLSISRAEALSPSSQQNVSCYIDLKFCSSYNSCKFSRRVDSFLSDAGSWYYIIIPFLTK